MLITLQFYLLYHHGARQMSTLLVFLCSSVHQFRELPLLYDYLPAYFPLIPSTIYCLLYLLTTTSCNSMRCVLLLTLPSGPSPSASSPRMPWTAEFGVCLHKENSLKPKAPNLLSPLLLPLSSRFTVCPQRI